VPKAYRVSPRGFNPAGQFTSPTFGPQAACASQNRSAPPTGTRAGLVAAGLVRLHTLNVRQPGQVPSDVCDAAVALFFAEGKAAGEPVAVAGPTGLKDAMDALEPFADAGMQPPVLNAVVRDINWRDEVQTMRVALAGLTKNHEALQAEYDALMRSAIGQAATAAKRVPPIDEALAQFKNHMRSKSSASNADSHESVADKSRAFLPPTVKTLADVTAEQIDRFISQHTLGGDGRKPMARRRAIRTRLGRLINWSAKLWGYPSPMGAIMSVSQTALARERGISTGTPWRYSGPPWMRFPAVWR